MRVSKHALFVCSAITLAAAMPHAAKADQISQLQAQINALSAKLAAIHLSLSMQSDGFSAVFDHGI